MLDLTEILDTLEIQEVQVKEGDQDREVLTENPVIQAGPDTREEMVTLADLA